MMDFDFINPTRIVFGEGKEKEVGSLLSNYGYKRALLVYGGGSIKRSGLYDVIVESLKEAKIAFLELSGIKANPDVSFVKEGLSIVRKNPVDVILAIGGGSVIDVAKSVAVSYFYKGDPLDFNRHRLAPSRALPIAVILTIASAGSESSDSCVISSYEEDFKGGFNSPLVRPFLAIEDPVLLKTVPLRQRNAGIVDMMMHSMERFFAKSNPFQLADDWSLSLIKNVKNAAKTLLNDQNNMDALAALMLDSSLAHDGLTSLGKKTCFVVHPLEHALSGYNPHIIHGEGIAVCYLGWSRYVYKQDLAKFSRLARFVFDIKENNDEKAAIMGIEAMEAFYKELQVPCSLKELGLFSKDIPSLTNLATGNGTRVIGCYPQSLNKEDVEKIYNLCL